MLVSELGDNPTLEEVQEAFAADQFATQACHCRVVEARRGHAVCEFDIEDIHRNGFGAVMGGAIFTLADYYSINFSICQMFFNNSYILKIFKIFQFLGHLLIFQLFCKPQNFHHIYFLYPRVF